MSLIWIQKNIWFIHVLHFFNIQIKEKKKKRLTYLPSQFSDQKGKQTFIFLGLIIQTLKVGLFFVKQVQ